MTVCKRRVPEERVNDTHVFAYGSNMCVERLFERVGHCPVVGTGYASGWRFAYHKKSVDGSAKANAFSTGNAKDRVYGVVYRLLPGQKQILDRHESLGVGYDETEVEIVITEGSRPAWLYTSRIEMIDETMRPYHWYHRLVLRGAKQHGLPEHYVSSLREQHSVPDRDNARRDRNLSLLGRPSNGQ